MCYAVHTAGLIVIAVCRDKNATPQWQDYTGYRYRWRINVTILLVLSVIICHNKYYAFKCRLHGLYILAIIQEVREAGNYTICHVAIMNSGLCSLAIKMSSNIVPDVNFI